MSRADGAPPAVDSALVFGALGDPTRLGLIVRLSDGRPRSIVQLAAGHDVSRQAVTKHLRVLERAGLVRTEQAGRERRFSLAPERLGDARAFLDAVAAHWDDALARLKVHVED